jgi:hypothetical protein
MDAQATFDTSKPARADARDTFAFATNAKSKARTKANGKCQSVKRADCDTHSTNRANPRQSSTPKIGGQSNDLPPMSI